MVTLAMHLRFLDFDALEFQLAGMYEIGKNSLFLFPKVTYKFTDDVRLSLGAVVVEALPDSGEAGPGSLFDRNDSVLAEFKWSF